MCDEWQTRQKESDVDSDEPRHPDRDANGQASPPTPAIIPGNVGSLDDVPSDVLEEEMPTVDDEGTGRAPLGLRRLACEDSGGAA